MFRHVLMFLPSVMVVLGVLRGNLGPCATFLAATFVALGFLLLVWEGSFSPWCHFLRSALISLAGALATFFLANSVKLGTLVASGLVGILGGRLLKEEDQLTLYLGAFVGMSSLARFPSLGPLLLAGLVGGILRELLDEAWVGIGGRLGTMAAIAVLIILMLGGGGW